MGRVYVSFVSGFWGFVSDVGSSLALIYYFIVWRVLKRRRKHAPDKFPFSVINVRYECHNTNCTIYCVGPVHGGRIY
jgi:hypothetical protein